MKNLKSILGILVILFLMSPFLYSQDIGQGEFMIVNQTGNRIIGIEICPMGAIFSGGGQYTVDARYPIDPQNNIKYIYPTGRINIDYQGYNYTKANFDYTELRGGCAFTLGYGKYQISFFDENGGIFTCYIDFSDANFKGITTSDYYQKLRINIRYNSGYNFSYNFIDLEGNNTSEVPIVLLDVIQVWQQLGTGNDPLTPSKGNFNDTLTYRDFPIVAYEHGAINHFNPQQVFLNFKVKYDGAFLHNDRSLYFNNCNFTVDNADNEITFTINSFAPTLYPIVISGAEGNFIAGGHSTIKFSEGEGIKIENQAKIDLNGAKFNSSSGYWGGINLIDPGPSTINNCEFTNANTAIYSSESFTNLLAISNCTFNNSITGINLNYATNISILSNHFWLPDNPGFRTTGLSVYNGAFSEEDNNLAPWFRINIIGNDFHYGNQHLIVCGISEQLSPVYISKNIFEDGGQNMVLFNTYGSISENNIQNSLSYTNSNNCVNITSSNPDFLNNILNSNNNNFELFSSHPNFAPLRFDNQFFWKAGKNNLTTRSNQFNILIPSENFRGNFYTEYGRNVFNSSNYHLYAYLDVEELYYKSVENCWKNGENQTQPIYDLINTNNEEMVIEYNPTYCNNMEDQIIDRIITDMGNGVFDTVLVTQSSTIPPPSNDESLYGTGVKNKLLKNYSSAIANFKNLINTYPNSKHLGSTVFNLYECYVLSDTNRTQSFRNVIFGDLKNFLEDKIQQYENNDEFVNVAYDFTLKCKEK